MGKSQNILLALALAVFFTVGEAENNQNTKDWWETASFYQIYPRSFKDSDGDGIGDLNGITEKLDYLNDLGVTATWLSPIFKSPMADFGYDISNFYEIQPEFGTLDDLDRLLAKAKFLGIKIILDLVPNHSSDEHEWFQKSVNRLPGYEDYYIWHAGWPDQNNASNRWLPNNWISAFRGSAWQWNEQRGEFYLHQFLSKQPDLNFRNPAVEEEMNNVMRFWLDRGVAGFRIDSVKHIYEALPDYYGKYPDEPSNDWINDPEDYDYLNHIYTADQPETIDLVYRWRQFLDDYKNQHGGSTRIMMTESYSPVDVLMQYYGNRTHNGAHIPFNFDMIFSITAISDAQSYINSIDNWMKRLPPGRTSNWVIGNHDNSRTASRIGTERIDSINMILMTLPGASVTYNGEEIGMTDQWISWEDTIDPKACNTNPGIYQSFSRDPARTPFQWNADKNAGFSEADKTWLPVATNYRDVNVALQSKADRSHLKVFKSLERLRWERTLMYGRTEYAALNYQTIVIYRQLSGQVSYITVANVGPYTEYINLPEEYIDNPREVVFHIVSVNSQHNVGERLGSRHIELQPRESFVLRTKYSVRRIPLVLKSRGISNDKRIDRNVSNYVLKNSLLQQDQ